MKAQDTAIYNILNDIYRQPSEFALYRTIHRWGINHPVELSKVLTRNNLIMPYKRGTKKLMKDWPTEELAKKISSEYTLERTPKNKVTKVITYNNSSATTPSGNLAIQERINICIDNQKELAAKVDDLTAAINTLIKMWA